MKITKGNYKLDVEAEKKVEEDGFERAVVEKLGASIAYVKGKRFVQHPE